MKKCPYCGEEIQDEAQKCRYCKEWLLEKAAIISLPLETKAAKVADTHPAYADITITTPLEKQATKPREEKLGGENQKPVSKNEPIKVTAEFTLADRLKLWGIDETGTKQPAGENSINTVVDKEHEKRVESLYVEMPIEKFYQIIMTQNPNDYANDSKRIIRTIFQKRKEEFRQLDEGDREVIVKSEYYGIAGWLGLFCFGLVALVPFYTIRNLVSDFQTLEKLNGMYSSIETAIYIEIVLNICLGIFSLFAGINLIKKSKNAVKYGKLYLLSAVAVNVIDLILIYTMVSEAATEDVLFMTIGSIVICFIWYRYLAVSKRVHATYS